MGMVFGATATTVVKITAIEIQKVPNGKQLALLGTVLCLLLVGLLVGLSREFMLDTFKRWC